MNGFLKLIIVLIAFIQIIEVASLILERCGTGLYGVTSTVLFVALCFATLYIFLSRWA